VVNSPTSITVTTPVSVAGAVDVTVKGKAGTSTLVSEDRFTYLAPAPAITGINATQVSTVGGAFLKLTGDYFTGATEVKFGEVVATWFDVVDDHTIQVIAPAHAAGIVDVRVLTASGWSAVSASDQVEYVAPTVANSTIAIIDGSPTTETGTTYVLSLSVDSPAPRPVGKWRINWGDGTAEQEFDGERNFATHVFTQVSGGTPYSITAVFSDTFAAVASNSLPVTVKAPIPWVAPVAHWKMLDGVGSTALDSEAGSADAELKNGAAWTVGQSGENGTAIR
jgi:hypothetical protein